MNPDPSMKRALEGKTVVLTGAASGLGRAMAKLLAGHGAMVHALDLNGAALASLKEECAGPGKIHPGILDVRNRDAFRNVVDDIVEKSGRIDILFNNAGVTQLGEAQNVPFERWRWVIDTNLMGVIHGIELIYPVMIRQGHGHIVNTASIAGATGYATAAAYTTSKAAILELSRSMRAEAKAYGVFLSVACPGYVESGIFSQDRIIGADRAAVMSDLPVKPMVPEEAARLMLKGVIRRRKTIVFPFSAKVLWTLAHLVPSAVNPFQKKLLRVFRGS